MCGRYLLTSPLEALRRVFGVRDSAPNLSARWNIAPTQDAAVVRLRDPRGHARGERELALLRWGLVPYWASDPGIGSRMINARGETLADKPAFRSAFKARRCLVPADGFYEWPTKGQHMEAGQHAPSPSSAPGRSRAPVLVRRRDGAPFAFAGLWERWVRPEGGVLESFAIVTTAANEMLTPYHDRMPVILDPGDHDAWLDASADARPLLHAPPAEVLTVIRVTGYVNSVRHDDEGCVAPSPSPPPVQTPEPPAEQATKTKRRKTDERQGNLF